MSQAYTYSISNLGGESIVPELHGMRVPGRGGTLSKKKMLIAEIV